MAKQLNLMSCPFNQVSALEARSYLANRDPDADFAYVVTPNVDHVVRLNRVDDPQLRDAYRFAWLSLCDSRILRALAYLARINLPLVIGTDLVRAVLDDVIQPGDRVGIIGLDDLVIGRLRTLYPGVEIDHINPPYGFTNSAAEVARIVEFVERKRCRFFFFSVGSPRSEIVAHRIFRRSQATGLALCCGSSLRFITGDLKRAPQTVQVLHLEWLWRLASEPRRLARRYLVDGPKILPIYLKWLFDEHRART